MDDGWVGRRLAGRVKGDGFSGMGMNGAGRNKWCR